MYKTKLIIFFNILIIKILLASITIASQSISTHYISQDVINCGGDRSFSSSYLTEASIGLNNDTGIIVAGVYVIHSGFWSALGLKRDSDGDNIADWWERYWFGDLSTATSTSDYDSDNYSDLQEFLNQETNITDLLGQIYNPKLINAPNGFGFHNKRFWVLMMPAILSGGKNR